MTPPGTPSKFLMHFILKQRYKFIFCLLATVLWSFNETLFPFLVKLMVDYLQVDLGSFFQTLQHIALPLGLIILFWCLSELSVRSQGVMQIYLFPKYRAQIRQSVLNYIQHHSFQYFSRHFSGDIARKISVLPASCQTIMEIIFFNFAAVLTGVIVLAITMWVIKPIFSVILIIWLSIQFLLCALFIKRGNMLWEKHAEAESLLVGNMMDILNNIINVRLFTAFSYERKRIKTFQDDEINQAKSTMWFMEISRFFLGLNGLLLIFVMTILLVYGRSKQWVSLGDFAQIEMQAFWLLGWMWVLSYQMYLFTREFGVVSDALALVRQKHDVIDEPEAESIKISKGQVKFSGVSFSYQGKPPLFENLSVEIPAAKKIGLVGRSGAGKSSFISLLLRFYDVDSGIISIDEQDISKISQTSLRSQIAFIPQDPVLFHRSLMENIRYGKLDASDEEVILASKKAHCHDFIALLKEGYNTKVGERGVRLSGGQRQRIAIARAILKDAPILILDEATSALDSITEKLVQENLYALMSNRTTIVIAHRLSTLEHMDEIYVFDEGELVESGSHQALLEKEGYFKNLWDKQVNGFLPI